MTEPCKHCGGCDTCDRCNHCGNCRKCGKNVKLADPFPYVPYYVQPYYPQPIYQNPWYPQPTITWETPMCGGLTTTTDGGLQSFNIGIGGQNIQ